MPQISIIMTSYNVEKYIGEAIESIMQQTIGINNLELIIIDDASVDSSFKIIKQYKLKYKQIVLVKNQQRTGYPGNSKNIGLRLASGEYVMFLDGDDIMVNFSCEIMYKVMKKFNSDIVIGKYVMKYDEDERVEKVDFFNHKKYEKPLININMRQLYGLKQSSKKDISLEDLIKLPGTSCNRIYKLEFLRKKHISFTENQITGEDYIFNHKAMLKADKISYFPVTVFYYRRRADICNKSITQNFSAEIIEGICKQKTETCELYKNTPYDYDEISNCYFVNMLYYKIIERKNNLEELNRIFKDLKPNLKFFNIEDAALAFKVRELMKFIEGQSPGKPGD